MARPRLIAFLLVLLTLAAACTQERRDPATPTPEPTPGPSVVRFGYPAEPPTLDPLATGGGSAATRDILRPILPALFRLDERLQPQPDLVAAWPKPESFDFDPFSVTLRLRPATWSDGTSITASDVRFSFSKLKDGPTRWRYRFLRDVEVLAPDRFTLHFDRLVRRWWALFSIDDMVLPQHAYSDAWKNGPTVSGGPFAFGSWTRGLRVRLVRNARFTPQAPLAGVDVLFVPSDETRLQLLERGEIEVMFSEGESNVGRRAAAYGFGETTSAAWGPTWWELDIDAEKLGTAVAKAVVEATSSDLAAEILEDSGRPMEGIPPNFTERDRRLPEPWRGRGNLEVATKVLDDAGVRGGAERAEFQLSYANSGAAGSLATYLHFRLRDIGVTAELLGVEPDTFEEVIIPQRRAPVVLRLRRGADAPDAGAYTAASGQPGAAPVDDQVVKAETSVTADRLRSGPVVGVGGEAWTQAQRGLIAASTVAPLAQVRSFLVHRPGVSGVVVTGTAAGPLWDAHRWMVDTP